MKIRFSSALLLSSLLSAWCVPAVANLNEAGLAPVPGDQVPPSSAPLLLPGNNPTGYIRVPVQTGQTEAKPTGTGKKYYVAPAEATSISGSPKQANDDRLNTATNPWSLRKAVAAINGDAGGAGSVVLLYGGTYRGEGDVYAVTTPRTHYADDTTQNFTFKKPVTVQNVPGQQPWLKGSVITDSSPGVWQPATEANGVALPAGTYKREWSESAGQHFDFSDLQIDNWDKRDRSKNPASGVADMVFVDGKMLRPVVAFSWNYKEKVQGVEVKKAGSKTAQEQLLPPDDKRSPYGTFWLDKANNALYINIGADPTGKVIEINSRLKRGLRFDKGSGGSKVSGLGFAHYTEYGLFAIDMGAIEVGHCAFAWNGMIGALLRGSKPHAHHNLAASNGQNGLFVTWSNDALIEHNTISYNNVSKFSNNWSAAGIKIVPNCRNLVGRYNIVERNYGTGFWMDADVDNATVYGNIARNNDGLGIFYEIARGAVIAYNLMVSNGVGLMVADSSKAEVWNNTFVDNGTGFYIKGGGRVKSRDAAGKATLYPSGENVVKNNLFFDSRKPGGKLFVDSLAWIARSDAFVAAMDFNGYSRRAGAEGPKLIGWTTVPGFSKPDGPLIGEQTPRYATLAAFQSDPATAGFERNSQAFDGDVPLFMDVDNPNLRARDFRLAPGSPAIGKGTAQPAPVVAIAQELGRASNPVNLGAFNVAGK